MLGLQHQSLSENAPDSDAVCHCDSELSSRKGGARARPPTSAIGRGHGLGVEWLETATDRTLRTSWGDQHMGCDDPIRYDDPVGCDGRMRCEDPTDPDASVGDCDFMDGDNPLGRRVGPIGATPFADGRLCGSSPHSAHHSGSATAGDPVWRAEWPCQPCDAPKACAKRLDIPPTVMRSANAASRGLR